MVKRLQMFGEGNSELLQQAGDVFRRRQESAEEKDKLAHAIAEYSLKDKDECWPTRELSDALWDSDHRQLFRNLFLHFADISNPARPFHICSEWAKLVLEEFFAQGDLEEVNGLPVGPLNDRARTNFPFSQISFIDFFVAPLLFATVRIFAPLEDLSDQLVENTGKWVEQWVSEEPPEDQVESVRNRLRKLEEQSRAMKPVKPKTSFKGPQVTR